jgi:hypothetical protein
MAPQNGPSRAGEERSARRLMTDQIEDVIASAALKQGLKASAAAMKQAAIDLAGSTMTADQLISVPGKGSISPRDYVNSLRNLMPEGFTPVTDKPATSDERRSGETLTDFMRRQVEATRKKAPLPDDFEQIRNRYAVGSLTRTMMDQIKTEKYGK